VSVNGTASAREPMSDGVAAPYGAAEGAVRLPDDQLERLADLIAERLSARPADPPPADCGLVSASVLAERLGCSRAYVYEHADALGAVRLGDGSRGRLRFDVDAARAALSRTTARYGSEQSQAPIVNAGAGSRRSRSRVTANGAAHWPLSDDPLPSRPHAASGTPKGARR
jgi:hypothetical protein